MIRLFFGNVLASTLYQYHFAFVLPPGHTFIPVVMHFQPHREQPLFTFIMAKIVINFQFEANLLV